MSEESKVFKVLKKEDGQRLTELVKDFVEAQISIKIEPKKFEEIFTIVFEDGVFQIGHTDEARELVEHPTVWERFLRLQAVIQCIVIEAQEEYGGTFD